MMKLELKDGQGFCLVNGAGVATVSVRRTGRNRVELVLDVPATTGLSRFSDLTDADRAVTAARTQHHGRAGIREAAAASVRSGDTAPPPDVATGSRS